MLDHRWRKSVRSGNNGACVEVRCVAEVVQVRDTKDRTGPVLSFAAAEWSAFLEGARKGDFDS